MALRCGSCFLFGKLFLFLFPAIVFSSHAQDTLLLDVKVDNVACWRGQQDITIPVYLKNPTIPVVAFELWLQMDRPDIAVFNIDSLDTVGTLLGQWHGYSIRSLGEFGYDLRIIAGRNIYEPAIGPQDGAIPLFKLLAHAYSVPDTLTDRRVQIIIQSAPENFSFAAPDGSSIGMVPDTISDTSWYRCLAWYQDICLAYEKVTGPPADSFFVDTVIVPRLDTNLVRLENGSLEIRPCGDANGDDGVNILDASFLINYLYRLGRAPVPSDAGDMNKDLIINILDISHIINALYREGPKPMCE